MDKPQENERFFQILEILTWVNLIAHVVLLASFIFLAVYPMAALNVLSILVYASCLYLNKKGNITLSSQMTAVEVVLHSFLAVIWVGWESGFHFPLLIITGVSLFYPFLAPRKRLLVFAVLATLYLLLGVIGVLTVPVGKEVVGVQAVFQAVNIVGVAGTIGLLFLFYGVPEGTARLFPGRLTQRATTDALTGLLNRNQMSSILRSQAQSAAAEETIFSLLLIEIDEFLEIDQRIGRGAADSVLVWTAGVLKSFLRKKDYVSRWEKNQFLLCLPGTETSSAKLVADRIRSRLIEHKFIWQGKSFGVTAMFGVGVFDPPDTLESCLQRIDRAIHQGQAIGVEQVVVADRPSGASGLK